MSGIFSILTQSMLLSEKTQKLWLRVFQGSQLFHIWLKLSRSEGDRFTFSGTHLWYPYVDVSNIGQYLSRRQETIYGPLYRWHLY